MRTVLMMIGLPAVGKSTIMKQFMGVTGKWEAAEPKKLVSGHYQRMIDTFILGKYSDGETFPGTDRLSMAVQPAAIEWMTEHDSHVVFEGDRLGTQSFAEFLADLPDTDFHIMVITASDETIDARHVKREDDQSEQFLRGRVTKIEGIRRNMVLSDYVTEFTHETEEDTQRIVDWMLEKLN